MEPPPEAPELEEGNSWLWRAWADLQGSRAYAGGGMGPLLPLPLSFATVDDYADRLGCDQDARQTLHEVIRALDREWRRLDRERSAAAANQPKEPT
ncbi:phage tail assembly chaperone [Pararoseomonas indoligenes]|uniref:Uncharacterized protein n=1 Tax=Roseomonas indoligenes TaxID=2820811 RepID=A0A940MVZ6_9PROT|nr:hypothetical protein [Pararoseomonas indoligenes]MBP0493041.1 hypothetical protein [Pararoseomonas indoligenes]